RSASIAFRVEADAASQTLPILEVGAAAWVDLPSDFRGRLVFLSADDGQPLVFGDDLLGFQIGDDPIPSGLEAPFLNLAAVPEDPKRIAVPAGQYRVIAVRGPEYELSEQALEALKGRNVALHLEPLSRVAETPGWIAADLHVHSGESFDSATPQSRQIAAFAASGAEVLVATEHDRIFDPRPALRATGLATQLVTITGVEVTSSFRGGDSPHATGHWNAFPVRYHPRAYRGGAPKLEGRRAHDMIADIRRLEGAAFLQLNHPRPGLHDGEGDTYFSHLGVAGVPYDPTRPLTRKPNSVLVKAGEGHGLRDLDYDGVELMNGPDLLRYRRVRADWFSLLLQGEFKIATANSDSHRLGVVVGLPRTYVEMPEDSLAGFSESAFLEALGAARAYGTTGPLLEVRLDETGLGGLHPGPSGVLSIHVEAAPWVPIREWRAYVNGELVHRAPIAAGEAAQLPLAFERDAFVTVEVEGPAEAVYAEALPGFVPFAFSNPIFVDVDGNGRFDAPGLPNQLPTTLWDPDQVD
ncbi:MAG: CehA/McbA family metallohydrolase, partial [Myxococcota bacterium]